MLHQWIFRDILRLMILFLLTAVPLFFITFIAQEMPAALRSISFWKAYFAGLGAFLISLPFLIIYLYFVDITFTPHGIFFYYWINDYLIFIIVGIIFFLAFYWKTVVNNADENHIPLCFSFWAGFFTLSPIPALIIYINWLDGYLLFVFPFLRILLLISCAMLTALVCSGQGYIRFLYLLLILPGTALIAMVPLYYYTMQHLSAYLIAGALVSAGLLGYVFFRNTYPVQNSKTPRYSLDDL